MIVVTSGRHTGRTTALATWLLGGHRLADRWPGWSRVLVVGEARRAEQLVRDLPGIATAAHTLGAGSLAKLIVTVEEMRRLRRGVDLRGVEVALDDADHVLAGFLGWRPDVVTLLGVAATPAELAAGRPDGTS